MLRLLLTTYHFFLKSEPMSTTKNLWGELPLAEVIRTPAIILREQATLLTEMTTGVLEGEVISGKDHRNKLYNQ